jgi:hypothetical protein
VFAISFCILFNSTFNLIEVKRFLSICMQVEIVMGLEESFGITVDESSAQSIVTVEDAANLIDELVAKKE